MQHGPVSVHVAPGKSGQLDLASRRRAWDIRFQPDRTPFVFKRETVILSLLPPIFNELDNEAKWVIIFTHSCGQ